MSASFSHSRSLGSSRWQFGGTSQRLRSTSSKKQPEPLRRAVADCLSSPSSSSPTAAAASSDSARTLRDYLSAPSTVDVAYCVLLEHTVAERDRSPAVVSRCVMLLKRYLLRYIPGEQTLMQIDLFCLNSTAECGFVANRSASPWTKSLSQLSTASMTSGHPISPSLPTSSIASGVLVKSLNYIRSLVARYLPRRPLQAAVFAGSSNASKQSLPTLSSLLSKSFNSQLSPVPINSLESPKRQEVPSSSGLSLMSPGRLDAEEDGRYITIDVLKWRWAADRENLSSIQQMESDGVMKTQNVSRHSFLEVGAAALLVGDTEAKLKDLPWRYSGIQDTLDLGQILQHSTVTTMSNLLSDNSHLRQITASKRMKPGPHQVWEDVPVSTFSPRAHPLFQYRHYSEQQPLRLNPAEVHEVIAAVCSETSTNNVNLMNTSSRLTNQSGKPSMDVAVSVLIKLVIDMYVLDAKTAAPLTLSMLQEMLQSPRLASRVRAFDLIINLGVHAHLLEPMLPDNPPIIEEEPSEEQYLNNEEQLVELANKTEEFSEREKKPSAIYNFELWILSILYEVLLLLVQIEERKETIWSSALSCLLYFVCDRGKIWKERLNGLDIRVIKVLLEVSREHSWAEVVHSKLICMLSNMFYQVPNSSVDAASSILVFIPEQVDLLGGIEFICLEYSQANSREEKRNLFAVLLDYVFHQINEMCLAAEGFTFSFDEVQPLATMLTLADAPEAFYLAVKHGLEGIGEILRGSISKALSRFPNFERLNMLLEKITRKFDSTIGAFTRLDEEFSYMVHLTKSHKFPQSIQNILSFDVSTKVKLSWITLHSLLHSERSAYRHNGYIWLVDLLVSEINEESNSSIWSNINNLRTQISSVGSHDSSIASPAPLAISILCGLLKSKYNFIRWGFLFVLEKLLMRLKLLLDEHELQDESIGDVVEDGHTSNHLEKANAVIDIMSTALSLVVQINETDRMNILKMCSMLFSQLCLRAFPPTEIPSGDLISLGNIFGCSIDNRQDSKDDLSVNLDRRTSSEHPLIFETASMAALLLRGYAFVPRQLVEHVPTALLYWPLFQLAGAATDDIALGVAVGSKGEGNLPGATSDIRAALLLLLIGKCSDPSVFLEVGREEFFRELLDDIDSRVAYYSSAFLLKRMMTEEPEKYQRMLQRLLFKAQQSNNEKLLENPYLQMRGIRQLSNDLGIPL